MINLKNYFFQYLLKLSKKWYFYIGLLLSIYGLINIYSPEPPKSYKTMQVSSTVFLILILIYAGYKVWLTEKEEKEKIIEETSEKEINLDEQEKEILNLALKNKHQINRFETDSSVFIKIGSECFSFQNDLVKTKLYLEALDTLIKKEFVKHQGGALYELTVAGCKKAEEIKIVEKSVK